MTITDLMKNRYWNGFTAVMSGTTLFRDKTSMKTQELNDEQKNVSGGSNNGDGISNDGGLLGGILGGH